MRTRFQNKLEKRPKTGKINMFNLQEKKAQNFSKWDKFYIHVLDFI